MSENSAVTSICERLHDLVLPDLCFPSKRAAPGSASSQSPQHHAALPARTTAARSVMNTIVPIAPRWVRSCSVRNPHVATAFKTQLYVLVVSLTQNDDLASQATPSLRSRSQG